MIAEVVRKGKRENISEVKEISCFWAIQNPGGTGLGSRGFKEAIAWKFSKTSKNLLALFNVHKVEYIIIGAYALAHHGVPRYTGDLDIFVRPSSENARTILAALEAFGFGSLDLKNEDFISPDHSRNDKETPVVKVVDAATAP